MKPVEGQTTLHQAPDAANLKSGNAWQSFTLQNAILSELAQSVQRAGLGGLGDILFSIIPPLNMEG